MALARNASWLAAGAPRVILGFVRLGFFSWALLVACSPRSDPSARAGATHSTQAAEQRALARRVERPRLARDVRELARVRPPGSAGWKQVQQLLAKRVEKLGYTLERQAYGSGVNLVATLPGARPEQVIVSAHYDHIAGCAGADDNASGLAAALEIARLLAGRQYARTLVIAFWDEEERGLIGSRAYAARARNQGAAVRIAISLDAIGYADRAVGSQRLPAGFAELMPEAANRLAQRQYRADFIAMVANPSARSAADHLEAHAQALALPLMRLDVSVLQAALAPDLFRSDHAAFWLSGYPSLLVTDTAELRNPGYHCARGPDAPSTLDEAFLTRVTGATLGAAAQELQAP